MQKIKKTPHRMHSGNANHTNQRLLKSHFLNACMMRYRLKKDNCSCHFRTSRKFLTGLAVHAILSFTVLGAVRVYQNGYNFMHHDKLCMAAISIQEDSTAVQVLHKAFYFENLPERHVCYYLAYILTDTQTHILVSLWHTLTGVQG